MRKFILIAILVIASVSASYAQNYTKSGKTYKAEKVEKQSSERKTGFIWEDSKGNTYPIYMGKTGACYIKRISKNTGKEYKQYLGTEISADICKQLGVPYTPKSTK